MAVKGSSGGDPYENLANAVVYQAVLDYRAALKRMRRHPRNQEAKDDIASLERFFRSDWYSVLTDVDGEYLIRKVKENI
jgi:hypothetical protein